MRRLAALFMVCGIALLLAPGDAEAQICNEKCVDIHDEGGQHVGFGCTTGGSWANCEATTNSCELDACGVTLIMPDDGMHWAMLPSCELDEVDWAEVATRADAREARVGVGEEVAVLQHSS